MNYFQPVTKYYIFNLSDKRNANFEFGGVNLLSYIEEKFPLLIRLEEEKQKRFNSGLQSDYLEYIETCKLIIFAMNYLNVPPYILALGNDPFSVSEPATNIQFCSINKDKYDLEQRRVSDIDLDTYRVHNYNIKVNNFINPSLETIRRANLTIEELKDERITNALIRRKNCVKMLRKGAIKNDN